MTLGKTCDALERQVTLGKTSDALERQKSPI